MAELAIGCSGFNYKHWRGNFYPEKLPQKRWFDYYCTRFSAVELNVTFYRLPGSDTFNHWYQQTPFPFTFAIKGSRFITHVKRLADPEEAVARYFDAALHLKEKLKVVLWQLSPGFPADPSRLHHFLKLISRYPVRHAFEFRHQSWMSTEIFELCREHRVCICKADWPEFLVHAPLTADFFYIRRHGHDTSHTGNYSREELERDARAIREFLGEGMDVYIYFNNDLGGFAPKNALDLMQIASGRAL